MTRTDYDVLVVGAGPAGITAAWSAATAGARVGLVDDQPAPGGQIWRSEGLVQRSPAAAAWIEKLRWSGVTLHAEAEVVLQPGPGRLRAETSTGSLDLGYRKLILATGARELFLPFPGWTLPGVLGAGGLQALVKTGFPVDGKRIVVAGSGPLLVAVAAYLRKAGAHVPLIAEQASAGRIARLSLSLLASPGKALEALRIAGGLRGTRYLSGSWPIEAVGEEGGGERGEERIESVVLRRGSRTWAENCDLLACGFGLVPNTCLASLLGCEVKDGRVVVGDLLETSVPGVHCAGEPTGIGGLECALAEGRIAGLAAVGDLSAARRLFRERSRARRFARAIDTAFTLREELRRLPQADTIVCRCEDVPLGEISHFSTLRAAKVATRCGMGPCQGRVCGDAARFLLGWKEGDTARPPARPARVSTLAEEPLHNQGV